MPPQKKRGRPAAKKPVITTLEDALKDVEADFVPQPAKPFHASDGYASHTCKGILANDYNVIKALVSDVIKAGNLKDIAGVYPVTLTIELNRTLKNPMGSQAKMQYLLAKQGTNILPIEYV